LRRGLERIARASLAWGPIGALHAARAEELELEALLAERIGGPGFAELAARRFRAPLGALEEHVSAFVERALGQAAPTQESFGSRYRSDDSDSPSSLVRKVSRLARELGVSLRIETRPDQLAIAATGHGVVAVRPGVLLSADAASRIALHEIVGHALPRMRSRHAPWSLLRAGTAGSVEAEEGRALLVEARAGHLDQGRKRELSFRHLAALGVRRGAELDETFRELVVRGADAAEAVEIAVRVHRGGGLGREVVYLPAYLEVRRAFEREPALERWFERGRVGLGAAKILAALENPSDRRVPHSSNSMNTGA
jgi:hypothetical protein